MYVKLCWDNNEDMDSYRAAGPALSSVSFILVGLHLVETGKISSEHEQDALYESESIGIEPCSLDEGSRDVETR